MSWSYSDSDRDAVYRVIAERRDIRTGFLPDAVPDAVLTRVLAAAHRAPSVGMAQPWDFLVIRSAARRRRIHEEVRRCRAAYAETLPASRAAAFNRIVLDAIVRAPVCVVVTCDPTRGGWYTLGTPDGSEALVRSVGYAIENLWLAARAEGVGVCLVAAFDVAALSRVLGLPSQLEIIACLSLGYVDRFPAAPGLVRDGWVRGRPLEWVIHHEEFGHRGLPGQPAARLLDETVAGFPALAGGEPAREAEPATLSTPLGRTVSRLVALTQAHPPAPHGVLALFAADTDRSDGRAEQAVREVLDSGGMDRLMAATGIEACVVDVGLHAELPRIPGLLPRRGTNRSARPLREDVVRAVETGIELARDYHATGHGWLVGDVLTADDSSAIAIIARLMNRSPAEFATMSTEDARSAAARQDHAGPAGADPLDILAEHAGLAVAALAGFILGARAVRAPVLLAGSGAAAAALTASLLAPDATASCFPVTPFPPGVPDPFQHLGLAPPWPDSPVDLTGPGAAAGAVPVLRAAAEQHWPVPELAAATGGAR
ncbi:MAG TPA: 5,6-dimethylbenzimidazole synthase [Actinophytocola sp.]|uniref:5,6-dimethylbenzimidazole synthase n=1 Tax=Actinophytocola sp. TaxID=1872138 RepID=UPI002DBFD461|nr:5,6-dimethylbenzimidazole synthase [Actinophytocola sp.]HEU5472494.1 5,6-dimethylbenzimidazole synthase [Actinophytocola sp.]